MTSRATRGRTGRSSASDRRPVSLAPRRPVASLVAASSVVVVTAGGAALAFAATGPAGSPAGSPTAGQPAALVLELADGGQVASTDVFSDAGARVDVLGSNRSDLPVDVGDDASLRPGLTLPAGCPAGSFVVADAEAAADVVLQPGESDLVGWFRLSFDATSAGGSTACYGGDMTFTWPAPDARTGREPAPPP